MPKCEYCGKANEEGSAECSGCGTPFPISQDSQANSRVLQASGDADAVRQAASRRMYRGALWCLGGIIITFISYSLASTNPRGGSYIVAWGAIIFGAIQFFKGLSARNSVGTLPDQVVSARLDDEDAAYAEYSRAVRLERQGNFSEAVASYEKIIKEFPGTGASNDAKASLDDLRVRCGDGSGPSEKA